MGVRHPGVFWGVCYLRKWRIPPEICFTIFVRGFSYWSDRTSGISVSIIGSYLAAASSHMPSGFRVMFDAIFFYEVFLNLYPKCRTTSKILTTDLRNQLRIIHSFVDLISASDSLFVDILRISHSRITISLFVRVHSVTRLRLLRQYLIITTLLSKYVTPLPVLS